MALFDIFKYSNFFLTAILVYAIYIQWTLDESVDENLSKDAISAIRRAKSAKCKNELRVHAARLQEDEVPHQNLQRRCHHDEDLMKFDIVGCMPFSKANASGFPVVRLTQRVEDSNECLETCFSYGHSYGGYHQSPIGGNHCLCGDADSLRSIGVSTNCAAGDSIDWFKINQGIYYPTATKCTSRIERPGPPIKIAFILTLKGRSFLQVKRLLGNIYSPSHVYYLHVDTQDNYLYEQLSSIESKHSNIILASPRFETIWGGPQLLAALIDAFKNLLQYEWNYVINLSESDFPIRPLRDLESHLQDKDCIFLRTHNLRGYHFIKKQGLDRSFYQCERRVWRLGRRKLPKGLIYSGGSDWFALPRSFSEYIVTNRNDPGGLVEPLLQLFNHTLLPAESFFHTLALNSEFCDKFVDNNLRMNNWKRTERCNCQQRTVVDWCGCSPHIYRASDMNRLKNLSESRDLFFSRKFDPSISQKVINEVERLLLRPNKSSNDEHLSPDSFWLNIYSSDVFEDRNSEDGKILKQMIALASKQIGTQLDGLKTVYQYFEADHYKGMIFELYRDDNPRIELFLGSKSSTESSLKRLNIICPDFAPYKLVKLEVGHGFDPSEKLFRNHKPFNSQSDLTVYHEWLVEDPATMRDNPTELLVQFQWDIPGREMFAQDIKLKPNSARSRLSFAHRLDRKGPLDAGPWTLRISHQGKTCVEKEFLVFESNESAEQSNFDRLFEVLDHCLSIDSSTQRLCSSRKWSLTQQRRLFTEAGLDYM